MKPYFKQRIDFFNGTVTVDSYLNLLQDDVVAHACEDISEDKKFSFGIPVH